jgi:hypothetical protein
MALGKSSIELARTSLAAIRTNCDMAEQSNKDFITLFNDPNFQKFVSETNKGKELQNQLQSLSNWIGSMCSTVESLSARTDRFLNTQESLNQ